ncbi:hypothetical protein MUP65_00690, partial [Patescibacteria group bacterium]|nr:hypothetical protein [Patescibacteria group bacterium]
MESGRKEEELAFDPKYFTQADLLEKYPDLLPKELGWAEMVQRRVVYSRAVLPRVFSCAQEFLEETPGPNQPARAASARQMFRYWQGLVYSFDRENFVEHRSLVPFEQVSQLPDIRNPRVNFSAGAEGHEGHLAMVRHMAGVQRLALGCRLDYGPTILCLEQDSYFTRPGSGKKRTAPFLPLGVRLSMWAWEQHVDYVTILPEKPEEENPADFYNRIFEELVGGPDRGYCFSDKNDPNRSEKTSRGRGAQLNPSIRRALLEVGHLQTPSTTQR